MGTTEEETLRFVSQFAEVIEAESKSRYNEDLANQLDLCGISLMDRIGNYEFSDNCSIQLSRATPSYNLRGSNGDRN